MNDVFNTFTVRIVDRNNFNRALELVSDSPAKGFDIGHSDMIFSFSDENTFNTFVESLKKNNIDIL